MHWFLELGQNKALAPKIKSGELHSPAVDYMIEAKTRAALAPPACLEAPRLGSCILGTGIRKSHPCSVVEQRHDLQLG